jgi:hypothetical protein
MIRILIALVMLSEWAEIKTDGFRIMYQPGMNNFAKMIAKKAPDAKKAMESRLGQTLDQEITIMISRSQEFSKIQPGYTPEWASATAYPEQNLIFLKPLARADIENYSQTFRHELAHLFIYHRLKGHRVPRWFDEVMALVSSTEFSFERFRILAQIGLSGKFIPFEKIDQGFPFNNQLAQLAYLQSQDMVGFLMEELGREKFQQLLDRVANGEDFYHALEALSGLSFSELENKWSHGLKYRYGLALAIGGSGSLWFIITLLFLMAYVSKKRKARMKREFMEYEDYISEIAQKDEDDEDKPDSYLH